MRIDQRGAVIERRPEAQRGPQWEYVARTMELDADLSQYGAEGWELVTAIAISHDPMMAVYHFKRRRSV